MCVNLAGIPNAVKHPCIIQGASEYHIQHYIITLLTYAYMISLKCDYCQYFYDLSIKDRANWDLKISQCLSRCEALQHFYDELLPKYKSEVWEIVENLQQLAK